MTTWHDQSVSIKRVIGGAGGAIAGKAFNSTTSSCDVFTKPGGNQPCYTVQKDALKKNLPYCGPVSNVTYQGAKTIDAIYQEALIICQKIY